MKRIIKFLREVLVELRKVVWPARSRAFRLTVIVVIATTVVGAFLAAVDFGLSKGVEYVIDATQNQATPPPGQPLPPEQVPTQPQPPVQP